MTNQFEFISDVIDYDGFLDSFRINDTQYISVSSPSNNTLKIYNTSFDVIQTITQDDVGCHKYFTIADENFLAISAGSDDSLIVYKYDGSNFVTFQTILTSGEVVNIEYCDLYLIITCDGYNDYVEIYKYDGTTFLNTDNDIACNYAPRNSTYVKLLNDIYIITSVSNNDKLLVYKYDSDDLEFKYYDEITGIDGCNFVLEYNGYIFTSAPNTNEVYVYDDTFTKTQTFNIINSFQFSKIFIGATEYLLVTYDGGFTIIGFNGTEFEIINDYDLSSHCYYTTSYVYNNEIFVLISKSDVISQYRFDAIILETTDLILQTNSPTFKLDYKISDISEISLTLDVSFYKAGGFTTVYSKPPSQLLTLTNYDISVSGDGNIYPLTALLTISENQPSLLFDYTVYSTNIILGLSNNLPEFIGGKYKGGYVAPSLILRIGLYEILHSYGIEVKPTSLLCKPTMNKVRGNVTVIIKGIL